MSGVIAKSEPISVRSGNLSTIVYVALWLVAALAAAVPGFAYYLTPIAERPYSQLHELFKPSGVVGQGLGILGSAMMVAGVASYSARRRLGLLSDVGNLHSWLRFHIFLCTLGPFFVLLHTTFRFGGIVSIAFWSMALVTGSGVFGRYVYARIPGSIKSLGTALTTHEERYNWMLAGPLAGTVRDGALPSLRPRKAEKISRLLPALIATVKSDYERMRVRRDMRRTMNTATVSAEQASEVVTLYDKISHMRNQIRIMGPFQRMFGYWHVFHLPLALIMLLIMIVHIAIAILFGYTWVF